MLEDEEPTNRLPYSLKSEATVRVVCDGFGWPAAGARATVIGRGAMARVWKLTTADRAYAIKEMLWGEESWGDTATEVRFRDDAVAAGLSAPESFPVVGGGHVLRLPAALGGLRYRAYTWVDGATVSDSVGRRQAAEWLGTTLGRLHGLRRAPVAPPDPWFEEIPGPAKLRSMLLAAARAGASWPGGPAAVDRMAELASIVVPSDPQSLILCHLDVKPDNVLRDAQCGYSLIDWDDFGAGPPDRELASVLLRWYAEGGDVDSDAVSRTLSYYRAAGGTVELGPSSFAMVCATSINYVHAQATIVLDQEQPHEARTFAADELRTTVRLLPDPAVLRKVLTLASPM